MKGRTAMGNSSLAQLLGEKPGAYTYFSDPKPERKSPAKRTGPFMRSREDEPAPEGYQTLCLRQGNWDVQESHRSFYHLLLHLYGLGAFSLLRYGEELELCVPQGDVEAWKGVDDSNLPLICLITSALSVRVEGI